VVRYGLLSRTGILQLGIAVLANYNVEITSQPDPSH
jgi:hypothetical protein